jgi:branched-chain amino acid transport system ATP-binding protein
MTPERMHHDPPLPRVGNGGASDSRLSRGSSQANPVVPEPAPGANPPALRVTDAQVVYGGASRALHGVSLDVPDRAIVALIGGNGAGKTTLLRTITGLNRYHRAILVNGRVEIFGRNITGVRPTKLVRAGVGQVMENRRIFPELTVEENLRVGGYVQRRNREALRETRARVMDLFPRLADRKSMKAGFLSGGEQQMLAIARALMGSPRLLLLDEPSLGLAPLAVEAIIDAIRSINRQGIPVLIVEQNATMALNLASQVYVLQTGTVIESGHPTQLAAVTEAYLGGSSGRGSPPTPEGDLR